jgi:uncharacterized protein YceH (UPF0502 family)
MTNALPQLTPEEIRVLGALIEKSKTTPDYYPLTLNGLITACNQKSARHPVVNYDQDTVLEALDGLKRVQLSATVKGDGRTIKYRQTLAIKHPLAPAEVTTIGLLLLRGPLTVGEIKNMSGRMYEFESLDEVQAVLDKLSNDELPFVAQMERRPGQKERRYCHLFAPIPEDNDEAETDIPAPNSTLAARVTDLEARVAKLEQAISDLLN